MKRRLYWLLTRCPRRLVYVVFPRASAKLLRIRGIRQAKFNRLLRQAYVPAIFASLWEPNPLLDAIRKDVVAKARQLGAPQLQAMHLDEIRRIEEGNP